MRNKDEITAGFEETFSSIINSPAFKKYSEMKLGLNIREYSMLIKKDIKELLTIANSSLKCEVHLEESFVRCPIAQ